MSIPDLTDAVSGLLKAADGIRDAGADKCAQQNAYLSYSLAVQRVKAAAQTIDLPPET